MEKLLVAQNELVSLQTCVWLAIEDPSHIERGMEELEVEQDLPAEVVQAEASRKKATSDLKHFRCVPDGMTGIELFHHQIAFCQRAYARKPHEHRIDPALGVFSPKKKEQKNLLSVDYAYKVQGDIMQAVGEDRVTMRSGFR
jgi:hypothetical protein